jgi:outer membrane protein assembly factor BamB
LEEIWRSPIGTNGVSIVDGVAYLGQDFEAVAFNAKTGAQIWRVPLVGLVPGSFTGRLRWNPAVGKNVVYFTTPGRANPAIEPSSLYAFDRATGATIPGYPVNLYIPPLTRVQSNSAPVLIENEDIILIVTAGPALDSYGTIRAFRASTGQLLWLYQTTLLYNPPNVPPQAPNDGGPGVGIFGIPAVDTKSGLMYIGTGQNAGGPPTPLQDSLMCLNYRTGTLVWYHSFNQTDIDITPPNVHTRNWDVSGGPHLLSVCHKGCKVRAVIVGSKEGKLYAFRRSNGQQLWEIVVTNPNPAGSAAGGLNYGGSTDGKVLFFQAMYSQDGLPCERVNRPTVTGTAVVAIDASTGHCLWRKDFQGGHGAPTTYANDVVYFATSNSPLTMNPENSLFNPITVVKSGSAAGTYVGRLSTFGPAFFPSVNSLYIVAQNTDGTPAPGQDFTGKIVLIQRSAVPFTTQVLNAQIAGAKAVVIYNNVAGNLTPTGANPNITIPSIGITQADGLKIVAGIVGDILGSVIAASNAGSILYGLSACNGKVLFKYPIVNSRGIGEPSECAITISNGIVYYGSFNSTLALST